ncbi:prepilin-type N-terminal cleavage/methylation domain-containing protein [Candidatus Nomurabacteria bacterium]|nr:prepilin-type N-terminal cleavage/methylation domain-containing protein [Candidatus Nomurabacteria bacterium]
MSTFSRFFHTFFRSRRSAGGFTLVELTVVVAIVVVLTGLILFRHSRFDSSTLLRSLAYSVALSVRQAQVYGTSVRGVGAGSSVYAPGFGVHFSETEPTRYFLFSDVDGDNTWEASETVTTQSLGRGFSIRDICAVTAGGTVSCMSGGGIDWMTVYFRRPNPEAIIYTSNGSAYSYAYIQVQSASQTDYRSIKVTTVGQIAVCGLNADVASC